MVAPVMAAEVGAQAAAGSSFGWGNVLGGLGSFGNMLNGLFGGDDGPGFMTQLNDARTMQNKMIRGHWDSTMAAAKSHGIHPLVALGVQPQYSNSVSYDGGGSDFDWRNVSDLGQDLSRAFDATATIEQKHSARMMRLAEQRGELENTLLASQLARMNQPATGPSFPARTIWLKDRDGSMVEVTNPEAGDNEILMLHDYITRTFPQDLRHMTNRTLDSAYSRLWGLRDKLFAAPHLVRDALGEMRQGFVRR